MIHSHSPKHKIFYLQKPSLRSTLPRPEEVVTLDSLGKQAIANSGANAVGVSRRSIAANNIGGSGIKKSAAIDVGSSHKHTDVVPISSQTKQSQFQQSIFDSKQNDQNQPEVITASNSTNQEPEVTVIGATQAIGIGQNSTQTSTTSNNIVPGLRSAAANVAKFDIQSFAKVGANVSFQDYPRAKWNYIFDKQKDLKVRISLSDEQVAQLVDPRKKDLRRGVKFSFFYIINGTRQYLPKPILNSDGRSYYLYLNINTGAPTKRKEYRSIYIVNPYERDETKVALVGSFGVRAGVLVDSNKSFADAGSDLFTDDNTHNLVEGDDGKYTTRVQTISEGAGNIEKAEQQVVDVPEVAADILAAEAIAPEAPRESTGIQSRDYDTSVIGDLGQSTAQSDSIDIQSGRINTTDFVSSGSGDLQTLEGDDNKATGVGVQSDAVGVGAIGAVSAGVVAAGIGGGQAGAASIGIGSNSSLRTPTGAVATVLNNGASSVLDQIKAKREAKQKGFQQGFGVITDEQKAAHLKDLHEALIVTDKAGFEINQTILNSLAEGDHSAFDINQITGEVIHKSTGKVVKAATVLASGDGQVAQFGLKTEAFESSNPDLRDFTKDNNIGRQSVQGGISLANFGAAAIPFAPSFLGANTFNPKQISPIDYYNSGDYVDSRSKNAFGSSVSGLRDDRSDVPTGTGPGSRTGTSNLSSGGGSGGGGKKPPKKTYGGDNWSDDPKWYNKDGSLNPNWTSPADGKYFGEDGEPLDRGAFGEGLSKGLLPKLKTREEVEQGQPYQDNNRLAEHGTWLEKLQHNLKNSPRILSRTLRSTTPNLIDKAGVTNAKSAIGNAGRALQQPVTAQNAIAAARAAMAAISAALGIIANPAFWLLMAILLGLIMGATLLIGSYCIKADPFPAIRNTVMEPAMWAGSIATGNPLQKAGALANVGVGALGGVLNGKAFTGEQLLPPSEFRKMIETALACKDKGSDNCQVDGGGNVRSVNGIPCKDEQLVFPLAGGSPVAIPDVAWLPDNENLYYTMLATRAQEVGGLGWKNNTVGDSDRDSCGPYQQRINEYFPGGGLADLAKSALGEAKYQSIMGGKKASESYGEDSATKTEAKAICQKIVDGGDFDLFDKIFLERIKRRGQFAKASGSLDTNSYTGLVYDIQVGEPKADKITSVVKYAKENNLYQKKKEKCGIGTKTATVDPLNAYFKDQRAEWQKNRDGYFGRVFGIPVSVTEGRKQAKASGNKVIDEMMRAFNAEMKGGLTVSAQDTSTTQGEFEKTKVDPETVKKIRQKLAQLLDTKQIGQVGRKTGGSEFGSDLRSDKQGYFSGFDDNVVLALNKLYESGISWVSGPENYGRSYGQHGSGLATDLWGLAYNQNAKNSPDNMKITSSTPMKGFDGYIQMHNGSNMTTPAPEIKGNQSDPRIFRLNDLSQPDNNGSGELQKEIIKIFNSAVKVLSSTKVVKPGSSGIFGFITHDKQAKVMDSSATTAGIAFGGHTVDVGIGLLDGSNGHNNHLHISFISKIEGGNFNGSGVDLNAGSGYLTDGKKCCKCTKSGDSSGKVDLGGTTKQDDLGLDLAKIGKDNGVQSISVMEVSTGKIQHYNGDTPPDSPASSIKAGIGYLIIKEKIDTAKKLTITDDIIYSKDSHDEEKGKKLPVLRNTEYTITYLLEAMLTRSSNGATNALIKELGGPSTVTSKLQAAGYKSIQIAGYLNTASTTSNTITANDFSRSMKDTLSIPSLKSYMSANTDKYKLPSIANKDAGNSKVTGNSGLFSINGKDYIISVFYNGGGNAVEGTDGVLVGPNDSKITDSTNKVIEGLKNPKKTSWLEDIIQKGLTFGSDIGINSPSILASAQTATPTPTTTTSKPTTPATPNPQPGPSPTPSSGDCGGGNVSNSTSGGTVGKIELNKLTEDQGALAMIAILEGGPNRPVQEHLDVAQAMANRAGNNFDNFGKTVVSQAFAPNQFKVIPDYSVKPSDVTSYDGSNDIKNFFTALQDPARVADSEKFVGGRVYFKASTSAVGGLRQGEVQRSKDSNFFHPPDNQNDKTVYKTINIASVIGGSTGTENIATKPTDTKPVFLPNSLTGNLRVDAQTTGTIVDREFDALYYHDIQKITDTKYDSPPENKIYIDNKNTNLKVGDRVRLIIAVNPNGTIGDAEKNKIVIYDVAKKVDLGDDGGLMPIRLPKSDITKFVTAGPRMGGLYKFKLYKVKEEDKNSTTVGSFNKPITSADINCPNGVEGNSADGLADGDFAGIMKKISTVYNKQCGAYIDSQKIIGKPGAGWQSGDLRGNGTGCCYAAVWAGLLINKLGNPNSAWAKAFPVIDSATGNTGSYAVDFHKAMQLTSSSGKKYYEEAGLIFSTDLTSAPIGAIAVVDDVSPPYGDINVKTGANEYVNYATMGFMSDKKTALGVYYPKK